MPVHVVDHPAVAHSLTLLRDKGTESARFRGLCQVISNYLIVEATRDLPVDEVAVTTPLEPTTGKRIASRTVVVPILRAGLGMLQSVVDMLPNVAVGYVGLERDETTAEAHTYYKKLPELAGCQVIVVDPMLATGGSAIRTLEMIAEAGGEHVRIVSIVAAPEGVEAVLERFPDVAIFTAALDVRLDENKYIRPGLGDFGDRLYLT